MAQTSIQAGSRRSSRWAEVSEASIPVETPSAEGALWICQTDLLLFFDSETRGRWRQVCKRACMAVEDSTRCLRWKDRRYKYPAYDTNQAILHQCPVLEKVCGLYPEAYHHLAGLPSSLRALEIIPSSLLDTPESYYELGHRKRNKLEHADLTPLSLLTQLEAIALHVLPASSLASLDFHTALRSLDLGGSPDLKCISVLKPCPNLHSLDLTDCWQLRDIIALSALSNLHTLNLSGCKQLQDITALSACRNLHTLHLCACTQLQDITALSACHTLHTLDLSHCRQLQSITALSACGNLHTLYLSGCEKIQTITALSACCELHTLDLHRCRQLQDITGLSACCNLHTLNLIGCWQLRDITALSACCNLQSLVLTGRGHLRGITALPVCCNLQSPGARGQHS